MTALTMALLAASLGAAGGEATSPADYDFAAMVQPVPATAKFIDPDYYIWCGTMVRAGDGKYHLFYSRWLRKLGHNAWVTHSEVSHAVGDSPLGQFTHKDVALPVRGKEFWDGLCTHNPTVLQFGKKFTWEGGQKQKPNSLERPQLYFENGRPLVLMFASDTDRQRGHSFNVRIPLRVPEQAGR
ncbi:MAG: hypothetical protein ACYC6Y_09460 [Thermoguttaceae bacterium]